MLEIRTTVKRGLPCRARLTHYSPPVCNRRGHWDDWLPDDPEEIEFELLPLGSDKPAPWLIQAASEKDWQRIADELLQAMERERACI